MCNDMCTCLLSVVIHILYSPIYMRSTLEYDLHHRLQPYPLYHLPVVATVIILPHLPIDTVYLHRYVRIYMCCHCYYPAALSSFVPLPNHRQQYETLAVTSRKLSDVAMRAWTIQKKEMYAVVDATKKLSAFLRGGPFILDTGNNNMLNWDSSSDAHWVDFIAAYYIVRKRHIPKDLRICQNMSAYTTIEGRTQCICGSDSVG